MSVILLTFHPEELDRADVDVVRRLAVGRRVVLTRAPEEIARLLGDVEIIAGFGMPYERLHEAPQLRWMQQWGAGVDWLMRHPAAQEHPFVLTNASGVHAVPISEHVIGQMLMFARGLQHAVRAQQRHEWWRPGHQGVFELYGATLLVVGVGAIVNRSGANPFAKQGLALHALCDVVARTWDPKDPPEGFANSTPVKPGSRS